MAPRLALHSATVAACRRVQAVLMLGCCAQPAEPANVKHMQQRAHACKCSHTLTVCEAVCEAVELRIACRGAWNAPTDCLDWNMHMSYACATCMDGDHIILHWMLQLQ